MTGSAYILNHVQDGLEQLRTVRNRTLLVAVSGGVDSQVLAHALVSAAPDRDLQLQAVHVDHGLRPSSGEDARQVADFCETIGLDCEVIEVDVEAWKTFLSQGTESAARAARYAAFARIASDTGADTVATGHTLDDQVETVLLKLIGGSGLEGLGGMDIISRRPVRLDPERSRTRRMTIFRPLLGVRRRDIESYANTNELRPIEDESNQSLEFRRNYVRHSIIPSLEEIDAAAVHSISRTASLLRDDARMINDSVDEAFDSMVAERSGVWMIERQQFRVAHQAVQRRVLLRVIEPLLPPAARLTLERIEAVRVAGVDGRPGSVIELPDGLAAYIDYARVAVGTAETLEDDLRSLSWIPLLPPDQRIPLQGDVDVPLENGWRLRGFVPPNAGLVLRTRRDGDRTRGHTKRSRSIKLQDWLVDRKVPQYVRDRLPMVESDGLIVWIIGLDITEYRDTTRDLHLHIELDTSANDQDKDR